MNNEEREKIIREGIKKAINAGWEITTTVFKLQCKEYKKCCFLGSLYIDDDCEILCQQDLIKNNKLDIDIEWVEAFELGIIRWMFEFEKHKEKLSKQNLNHYEIKKAKLNKEAYELGEKLRMEFIK